MLMRLIYFSENQLIPGTQSVLSTLSDILSKSKRNNKRLGLTGALVFDNQWFVQALEGEREIVWTTFERIREDDRHDGIVVAEFVEIKRRVFGNWWMGLATRQAKTEGIFAKQLSGGRLDPRTMSASQMLTLMSALTQIGISRELGSTS